MDKATKLKDFIKSKDAVFHYCKFPAVIEHILYEKQLRLFPRATSHDPIENLKPQIQEGAMRAMDLLNNKTNRDDIKQFIENNTLKTKQLCFCMNDVKMLQNKRTTPLKLEYSGFLKPRMWDQYADHYRGVCLGFSLKALKDETKLHSNKVKYCDYSKLQENYVNVCFTELKSLGIDKSKKKLLKNKIMPILFRKHSDYKGENEYRFISLHEEEEYINIEKNLKCIIVYSNNVSSYNLQTLEQFASEMNVDILYITSNSTGIGFHSPTAGIINWGYGDL